MRSRNENNDISVHAIAGTRVVILGLNLKQKDNDGGDAPHSTSLSSMLDGLKVADDANGADSPAPLSQDDVFVGFAIDRRDISSGRSTSLNFDGRPIQKFHFGDYTVQPGHQYEYSVRQMIKTPSRSRYRFFSRPKYVTVGSPLVVTVTTEDPSTSKHGVYFNRGVAGSRAYAEKFGEFRKWHKVNKYGKSRWTSIINPLSIPDPAKKKEAFAWLSRGLEEALLEFISEACDDCWQLRVTAYEFTHKEVVHAFAAAVERGVDVKIIHHVKGSYRPKTRHNDVVKDEDGKVVKEWVTDSTTFETQHAIDSVGFHSLDHARVWHHDTFIERHTSSIMHNKFIVLLRDGLPMKVWTGSTNFTDSAFYGQSNVGHIVRDEDVARQYLTYWNKLALDLPGRNRRHSGSSHDNIDKLPMDEINEQLQPDPAGPQPHDTTTVFFSPRKTSGLLDWYADQMGDAATSVHFTAAFGVSQPLAHVLNQDGKRSREAGVRRSPRLATRIETDDKLLLRYILLDSQPSEHSSEKSRASAEKKGRGNEYCDYFDFKKLKSNRIAYGAVLSGMKEEKEDRPSFSPSASFEHSESLTGLGTFVNFVHTKFMVVDALTENPTIITGSANFSVASIEQNDENMLVIQGDTAVADVYFTEFMRLFDHFYSRDKRNESKDKGSESSRGWTDVVEDDSWIKPFFDESHQLFRERVLLS